jgi:hypothetical protein
MGFFSFKTSEGKSIPNIHSGRAFTVYMVMPDNTKHREDGYDGYGVFGGNDFYAEVAKLNGRSGREAGITIYFDNKRRGENVRLPRFTEDPTKNWDDLTDPEDCPAQGYFYDDDDAVWTTGVDDGTWEDEPDNAGFYAIDPVDPKTPDEIRLWRVQETCRALLGVSLVVSDSHDYEDGKEHQPVMTEDGAWYFVPHYDDPVPPRLALTAPSKDAPVRPRWGLEAVKVYPATYWEPEDAELVEVARVDSLEEAFAAARHALLDQEIEDIGMGIYAQYEMRMAPFVEDYMTSNE